jgi:predicted metal-dependent hydrolase
MTDLRSDEDFARGVALFNAGRFFEAHEVWEITWKRSSGDVKTLLQGLIQSAAAILHVERGNLHGAASLRTKALAKLAAQTQRYVRLELTSFRRDLDAFVEAALSGQPRGDPPHLTRSGDA